MATYSVHTVKSASLSTTVVDTLNFDGGNSVTVVNPGSTAISFTVGVGGGTAATPTALGDDMFYCPATGAVTLDHFAEPVTQVKLIGSGNAYSVTVI